MLRRLNRWAISHQARAATLAGWFQQFCSIGGAAITIPIILARLGNREAGIWFSLQGVVAIFSLSDFGFSMAISRQVAHSFKLNPNVRVPAYDLYDIETGWAGVSLLYAAGKTLFLRVMMISICLFIISYQALIRWTHLLPDRNFGTAVVWYLLAASFALLFFTRLSQSVLDGLGYMYVGRGISAVYQIVCSVLSIVVLEADGELVGLGVVLLTGSVLQLIAMHASLRLVGGRELRPVSHISGELVAKLWRVSLPFGLVNTGGYLVGAVQVPLLGALLGPSVVAPIFIAFKLTQALGSTVAQIVVAQIPFFTHQRAQGHWQEAKRRMVRTLMVGCGLHGLTGLFVYFASPTLVKWWVGPNHYIGGAVLLLFSINYVVTFMAGIPAQFVLASGRNPFAVSTIMHGILTLGGMVVLCPKLGLLGAPLSGFLAVLVTNAWLNPLEAWKVWQGMRIPEKSATA